MDKYKVIGTLGEGSFGRVYKAKQVSDGHLVALKVIGKRGRSNKELKGFRRECEIQRYLCHPNIIQMLDSFETENEIVVITEFAHKELTDVLSKVGFLPEDQVQKIVWDLVSALFYLHSNRVLHRDLKPQNILLDIKNHAKLCDFGFARNMSRGTHVLTSIKGTPLYMAPELIDEQPYDYTADLWSLGCIIYEMLMGTPPFSTNSILHLIRLITYEQIQWPTFHSENCISFLKGLLQKNPSKRITWDEILNHPFVKDHIILPNTSSSMALTKPMTPNTLCLKEEQRKDSIRKKNAKASSSKSNDNGQGTPIQRASSIKNHEEKTQLDSNVENNNIENPFQSKESDIKNILSSKSLSETPLLLENENISQNSEISSDLLNIENKMESMSLSNEKLKFSDKSFSLIEDNQPMETEEWIAFLQKSIQEVLNGELISLTQRNQANILISPLRNSNTNSEVLNFVAKLLSLPLVLRAASEDTLNQIKNVYLEIKLLPNLVYASKLLLRVHHDDSTPTGTPSSDNSTPFNCSEMYKSVSDLHNEDFDAIEHIFLLITHLVYWDNQFIIQFCDAVVVLNIYVLLRFLLSLSSKGKDKIVGDVLAILTHVLRKCPENSTLVEKVLINNTNHSVGLVNFVDLLRHSNPLLRERTCYFLQFIGKVISDSIVQTFWGQNIKETLEALMYDSIEVVRNAAEVAISVFISKNYYNSDCISTT